MIIRRRKQRKHKCQIKIDLNFKVRLKKKKNDKYNDKILCFVNLLSMRNQRCDETFMSKLMRIVISSINHDQLNKSKILKIFF